MKKAWMRRSLALLLAIILCIGLLPMGALAAQDGQDGIAVDAPGAAEDAALAVQPEDSSEDAEGPNNPSEDPEESDPVSSEETEGPSTNEQPGSTGEDSSPWKIQDWGGDQDIEIQEGWITPAESGNGFTLNYSKIISDRGVEGLVLYDSAAEQYADSTIELDLTVIEDASDSDQARFYSVAVLPRFSDGKNCEGMAIHNKGQLQRASYEEGNEDWDWVREDKGDFLFGTTYHLKLVTEGTGITVSAAEKGQDLQELVTFSTKTGIRESGYGFRVWRGAKTVKVENIQRTQIQNSRLGETEKEIAGADWPKGFSIPVNFVAGDSITSIKDGDTPLTAGSHYSVVDDTIQILSDYMKNQGERDSITLVVTFANSPDATFTAKRKLESSDPGKWKIQMKNTDVDVEIQPGWITPASNGKGFTINYTNLIADIGEGISIYDSEAAPYLNSRLEFDLTMTDDQQDGYFAAGPFTRYEDGSNCEGFVITKGTGLQRSGWKDGGESWADVDNALGLNFEFNKTYHLRLDTVGNTITVYAAEGTGELEKLSAFESPLNIGASTYGFRMWRGGKTMSIQNIERTEIILSGLGRSAVTIEAEDWGQEDVSVPVSFGAGDSIASVSNGDTELMPEQNYTVADGTFTLKKEYISTQDKTFRLQVSFAKGSTGVLWIMRHEDGAAQEYTWTPDQGIDMWKSLDGSGTFTMAEDGSGMLVSGRNILLNELAPIAANGEIEFTFEFLHDNWQRDQKNHGIGSLFRVDDVSGSWQSVAVDGYVSSIPKWSFINSDGVNATLTLDGDTLLSRAGLKDYVIKHRFENDALCLWLDNQFAYSAGVEQAEALPGGMGLMFNGDLGDVLVKKVVFREVAPLKEAEGQRETVSIEKDGLTVRLDSDFPRVVDYTLNSKVMHGSQLRYNYVTINTLDIPAAAAITKQSADSITYHVTPDPEKSGITFDVVFTAKEGHVLEMLIQNIQEPNDELLYSIAFPDQPLISANSAETGASLDASWLDNRSTNWGIKDLHEDITRKTVSTTADFGVTIPIISNGVLSASMHNNVFNDGNEFVYRGFQLPDGEVTAGFWNNQFIYRGLDNLKVRPFPSEPGEEDLYCRIAIAEDTNADDVINWQDGANAAKAITNGTIPGGGQAARSFFHVGYNFSSGVQQPFLQVADNMKRLSNCMDGFGQQLIFKGYGNEGHDSGHADYEDINRRAGGAEDMNVAIAEADKINSNLGIHLNNQEAYPEAKMYTDLLMSGINGWAWMDQSKYIRRDADMLSGSFDARLDQLFAQTPDLDFVYVDCWQGDRWNELKFIGNMMRNGAEIFGNENAADFNRFGVWVHSTGGTVSNGIHQFVYNNQKDVYPGSGIYWGGYNRGASMMSWQHNNNINTMVEQFFTNQLPQKYLMCHEVLRVADNTGYFSGNITSGSYVITKDGNKLTDGQGKIFIPWYAEDSTTKNPDEAAKIYHWNSNGGSTTWTLPKSWNDVTTVYLYKTTQNGKVLVDTLTVDASHQITINAGARTGYVLYPAEAEADVTEWSVGSPLKDTGFNSRDFSVWHKGGDADIQFNDDSNGVSILTISGTEAGQVSQTMTGLTVGQKYRVKVDAGAENGKTARITVKNGNETVTAYLEEVTRTNNYFDDYAKNKMVQRMWVDFTAAAETAEVILSADACEDSNGEVTFMQSRVVRTAEPDLPEGYVANETFEYVEQGAYGIFNPERSADGVPHLSETHLPYTNDTISGNWSLKLYGHYGQGNVTVRTSPGVTRLEPNTDYTVEFDTLGNGKVYVQPDATDTGRVLEENFSRGHSKFTFTTGDRNDYVIRVEDAGVLDNFQVYEAEKITKVTGVTVKEQVALKVGDTTTLTPEIAPANASNQSVSYVTDNAGVARVTADGVVEAIGIGSAEITVTTVDGGFTAVCTVTVTKAGGGSGDSGNSSGGGGTSTPPTNTTVEKNPDGSTTTTVTDKKTGTVTETTEWPDGTKQIVETRKDGTVTQTTEKADGSKQVVETRPDGTVTEIKTDAGGAKAEKVTDPEKNTEIKVTDPTGEVLAEVKLPAEVPAPEKRFEDVPEGHWADEAIHEMAGLGVVSGVGDGRFDMSSGIKRGDLALLLARLSNAKTEDVTTAFTDVPAGKYYAGGVAWAAKNGIVTGRSEDTFDPEATITRGELAVMLYRYAKLLKLDTAADAGALDAFKDGSASPDWAVDGLAWCVGSGIIRGRDDNSLDPGSDITRAEVAVMLQRFVNLMK